MLLSTRTALHVGSQYFIMQWNKSHLHNQNSTSILILLINEPFRTTFMIWSSLWREIIYSEMFKLNVMCFVYAVWVRFLCRCRTEEVRPWNIHVWENQRPQTNQESFKCFSIRDVCSTAGSRCLVWVIRKPISAEKTQVRDVTQTVVNLRLPA